MPHGTKNGSCICVRVRRLPAESSSFMTGQSNETDVTLSDVILNSTGLQQSFTKYGTWLLSQSYPEGSPTHPEYPTGHGVVGGACITVLKFFFNGNFVIPNPKIPSDDGLSLLDYTGSDADE